MGHNTRSYLKNASDLRLSKVGAEADPSSEGGQARLQQGGPPCPPVGLCMSAIQLKDVISELKSMGDSDAAAAAGLAKYGDDGNPLFFFLALIFRNLSAMHLLFDNARYGFHRLNPPHLPARFGCGIFERRSDAAKETHRKI